ncbi:MAG: hypothetical protein EBR82_46575 [Caulobacteraceae bacterium]|nr:hypothetical protein [Caulobacteraceae bacterium]
MDYYIKITDDNSIVGYTTYEEPAAIKGFRSIKVDFNPAYILSKITKHKFIDNKVVDTQEPIFPSPNPWSIWDKTNEKWVDGRTQEQKIQAEWQEVIEKRNQLLQQTDWTDTYSAVTRLGNKYSVWQEYRQALRDITNQSDPFNIVWPVQP